MTGTCEAGNGARTAARPAIRLLFLLIVAAVLVAGGVWIVVPPKYRSTAVIRIVSLHPKQPMELRPEIIPVEILNRWVREQALLVRDETVLREAMIDPALRSTAWFTSQTDKMEGLERLKRTLRVEPVPDSNCIKLSFAADHPKDAARIVNTVAHKYLDRVQNMAQIVYKSELTDYRTQESRLVEQLEAIHRKKQDFLDQQPSVSDPIQGLHLMGESLRALTVEATQIEQEKLRAKLAYDHLTGAGSADVSISPALRWAIDHDPEVTNLRDLKVSLEIELESAAMTQPESGPADNGLQRRLKVVDQKLSEMLARKEREARTHQADSAYGEYQAAIRQELAVRERIMGLEAKQRDVHRGLDTYRNLEEQQNQIHKALAAIREYVNRLILVIKERGIADVQLITALPSEARDNHFQVQTSLAALAVPLAYGFLLVCVRIVRGPRRKVSALAALSTPVPRPPAAAPPGP